MSAKTYDPACYDLAASFLSDHPEKNTEANRDQLAALIQRTIEDDIEFGMESTVPRPERGASTASSLVGSTPAQRLPE
jgi:hypothetical protein